MKRFLSNVALLFLVSALASSARAQDPNCRKNVVISLREMLRSYVPWRKGTNAPGGNAPKRAWRRHVLAGVSEGGPD